MKDTLEKAFTVLEKAGFSVKNMNESTEDNIVDVVKSKLDKWKSMRNTPEGDDLWDEMIETYGSEIVDLVSDEYEDLKKGNPIDVSLYLRKADVINPKFIDMLKKLGISEFKLNTKVAFNRDAYYLYLAMNNDNLTYLPPKSEMYASEYAYFRLR